MQVKTMGNVIEIRSMKLEATAHIQKVDAEHYICLSTGEYIEFAGSAKTRADNLTTVRKSLARLRDIINTNVTDYRCCRWITLTYRENMTDTNRLYEDFRKFNMRLKYYCEKHELPHYEYIVAMEPQGRGAWHVHMLAIFENKAPYIPNDELALIWGNGYTKIKSLRKIDNPGAYLTAYLGDMELTNTISVGLSNIRDIKQINTTKAVVKGARIRLYPAGFRIFRKSRGVALPLIENCTEFDAMKKVGSAALTFEKTIKITSDKQEFVNMINYRHFNRMRGVQNGGIPSTGTSE